MELNILVELSHYGSMGMVYLPTFTIHGSYGYLHVAKTRVVFVFFAHFGHQKNREEKPRDSMMQDWASRYTIRIQTDTRHPESIVGLMVYFHPIPRS